MTYVRNKKLRRRNDTMDISLMEHAYEDAYSVTPYCAQDIKDLSIKLITFNGNNDKLGYEVLSMSEDLYSILIKEITSI